MLRKGCWSNLFDAKAVCRRAYWVAKNLGCDQSVIEDVVQEVAIIEWKRYRRGWATTRRTLYWSAVTAMRRLRSPVVFMLPQREAATPSPEWAIVASRITRLSDPEIDGLRHFVTGEGSFRSVSVLYAAKDRAVDVLNLSPDEFSKRESVGRKRSKAPHRVRQGRGYWRRKLEAAADSPDVGRPVQMGLKV